MCTLRTCGIVFILVFASACFSASNDDSFSSVIFASMIVLFLCLELLSDLVEVY